jgi:3-isopropylmalate dehydrogenase
MMRRYDIAVLPGDGIGPEVMAQARRVLARVSARHGFTCFLHEGLIGQAALDAVGRPLPPETLRICRAANAVLMGPVAGSNWDDALSINHPKQAVLKLRAWLNTYATVRRLRCPDGMDVLIVYDHSSGLFYGSPRGIEELPGGGRVATNTEVYSTGEVERALRMAFQLARGRQKRVHEVDNAKYLETGEIWRDCTLKLAAQYQDLEITHQDAAHFFFDFMIDSKRYDVIVTEMVIGHLVASAAAGRTGALPIHAAAYLGGEVGLFQPSHGAALELAGRGVANPQGMIRAVALMLEHSLGEPVAAAELDDAIEHVVRTHLTPGAPPDHTVSLTEAVLAALPARPEAHELADRS